MLQVSIAGGSGYVGGELLRLLLAHPELRIKQVTSERHAGQYVHKIHPNLRGQTELRFTTLETLEACDLLLLALPHGEAARRIDDLSARAPRLLDCSADFRLRDAALFERWYSSPHPAPEWLDRFVYGLPELNRDAIGAARYVSGVGCNATAVILALLPLVRGDLLDRQREIIADVKVGSSEAGADVSESSHHPERSGVVRTFAPVRHRHTAEVMASLGLDRFHLTVTSVELVRGVLATCHAFLATPLTERELWGAYRELCGGEPFVRIVHEKLGIHRHPEPKLLAGSNYADIGWALDESTGRIVALCALDNLMKGAAGTAVQCLNLMFGFPERTALEFPGIHPS
ncbi:MAG: N-acetyl-gamma-glutamyl-phosphate reductase [Planctomycetota bacterium]